MQVGHHSAIASTSTTFPAKSLMVNVRPVVTSVISMSYQAGVEARLADGLAVAGVDGGGDVVAGDAPQAASTDHGCERNNADRRWVLIAG